MEYHNFVLVLNGIDEITEEQENALFEAGCDDATISVRFRRVWMNFSREATTRQNAILSAIKDVNKAGIEVGGQF